MSVGVLGPLAVDGDGDSLAPRDRVVLAALAMCPREAVRPERLADALWGDEPPATWPKVVQSSMVRIRKALGAEAVRTTRHGYVLDLPDEAIDAFRFERLVARGRELLALGEADRARYQLRQALDLWHGGALADLEGWEPAEAAAKRWEELRRDAEELAVDASLRAGAWRDVLAEAGRLVAQQPFRETRWALLARAQYQGGRQGEALATLQRARAVLAGELGLDPGPELTELEASILHQDPGLLPAGDELQDAACPYRGLLFYDVDDAERYFGRDAEVAACREILERQGAVAVVGPSGSGKSSLVRAGIAASLRAEGRTLTLITPGPHPMAALGEAGGLRRGGVLLVDQLEEVVTLCEDPTERQEFLATLAGHEAAGAELVLALRADRLGALSANRPFARLVERGLHLLGAMDDDDLRAAVEGPARQAGLLLEAGLADLLVREVSGEPGALPLLSHALAQTWERREGRTLTVEGYRRSDGIRGAVAQTAERVFLALGPDEQEAARELMLRLVVPGGAGEPARSPLPRRIAAPDRVREDVIELLVAARLITSDGDVVSLAHESLARAWPRLRGWLDADTEGQLVLRHLTLAADSWQTMGRPDSELYRGPRLARALEWRAGTSVQLSEAEAAFLDASQALAEAEERSAEERLHEQATTNRRLRGLLGGVAALLLVALIAGVLAVKEGDRADEEARLAQVRELAAASRAVRADDAELAVLLALESTSRRLNDGDPPQAALEALHEAVTSSRIDFAVANAGGSVAHSPADALFATEGPEESGLVDVRDAETGESAVSFEGHDIDVNDVAFSTRGLLATAGDDGALRVWDPAVAESRNDAVAEVEETGEVWGPSFAADRPRRLAAAWPDEGVVRVATLRAGSGSPEVTTIKVPGYPLDTSLSPDGSRLAVGTDNPRKARVVDARTGKLLHRLPGQKGPFSHVAYSPDGRWLATANLDGTVRVRDGRTGRTRHTLSDADSEVLALDWSRDSSRLATGGFDGKARVYDVSPASARLAVTLSGAQTVGSVYSVAFSTDGDRLIVGDRFVRAATAWDVGPSGDAEVRNIHEPAWRAAGVAYGPDGSLFLPARRGGVAVWDADGERSALLVPAEAERRAPADDIALSPDGRTVATGQSHKGSTVWDVETGEELFSTPRVWRWRPAFSPDGEHIAFAGDDGMFVRTRDGEIVRTLPAEGNFSWRDPTFSPDGRTVVASRVPMHRSVLDPLHVVAWHWEEGETESWPASGAGHRPSVSPDGTRVAVAEAGAPSRVYDIEAGEVDFELQGAAAGIAEAVWSPDGSRLATAGLDGTAIVWDARDGTPLLRLRSPGGEISRVAFSADGQHLATGSHVEDVVRLWTLDLEELRGIAETKVVRELTDAECREYLHRACG